MSKRKLFYAIIGIIGMIGVVQTFIPEYIQETMKASDDFSTSHGILLFSMLFILNSTLYSTPLTSNKCSLLCSLFKENKLLTTESKAYFQKDNKTLLLTSLGAGFLVGLTIAFIFLKFFK